MSKVLLSYPHDHNFIKEWAKILKKILIGYNIDPISINTILNSIAKSFGYTDWAHLAYYNTSFVWFTDINSELHFAINNILEHLEKSLKLDLTNNSSLYNDIITHICIFSSSKVEPSDSKHTMELLLVPLDNEGGYNIIPFISELDLVFRIEFYLEFQKFSRDIIKIKNPLLPKLNSINRSHTYPLYNTINELLPNGYLFIARHKCQYVGFNYVLDDELDIPPHIIEKQFYRLGFVNPTAMIYKFHKTKNKITVSNVTTQTDTNFRFNVLLDSPMYHQVCEALEVQGQPYLYLDFEQYVSPLFKRPKVLTGDSYVERCNNLMKEHFYK